MIFSASKAVLQGKWLQVLSFLRKIDAWATIHHTALFWALCILYKFALDALYIWTASPLYAYAGLVYQPSSSKYILSAVLYLILFAALPKAEHRIPSFLLHIQFLFTVAPLLSFYALSDGSTRYILMVFCCILLQAFLVRRAGKGNRKPIYIKGVQNYVTVALGVLTIFTIAIPIIYNGFAGLKAFDFQYIYTMRENASYPPGFDYILYWVMSTILPLACLIFLHRRDYRLFALCVALQVLLYMETGTKFTLFILIPVIAVYLLAKTNHPLKLIYAGFILLCIGIVFLYQLDKTASGTLGIFSGSLIAVRAIFHPADNKFNYYEYFSTHPKVFFSDGQVGKMFSLTYPYAGSIGQVSYAAGGGEFLSANMNTGYLGEAYAQMGFPGMLLMAALLGLIVRALGIYHTKAHFCIISGLFSVYFIILNDGALFTTLFTGGMLLAFLLVFIYFGKQQEEFHHGIQRL